MKRKRRVLLGSSKHHTVYEGEGVGMLLRLELIREQGQVDGMVTMAANNIAVITATHAIRSGPGQYIWDIFYKSQNMVHNKHREMELTLRWVPGHMHITGNEKADAEVKKAATDGSSPLHKLPAPLRKTLPQSKSAAKQEYHRKVKAAAMEHWVNSPRSNRIAEIGLEFTLNKFTKLTCNISRNQASILFQLHSGHVPLNTYLHRIKKTNSPICPSCHQYRGTVMHFIM